MLDFCNAQKNRSEFKFFLSIVFTVDTKIRKEFYLLVYFAIFGGVRYFNVGICLLYICGSKGDILLWLSPWKKIIEGAPNGCVPISIWEDMRRNLPRFPKTSEKIWKISHVFLSFLLAKISRKGCLAKRMSIISWESLIFAVREVAQMGILALL